MTDAIVWAFVVPPDRAAAFQAACDPDRRSAEAVSHATGFVRLMLLRCERLAATERRPGGLNDRRPSDRNMP